MGIIRLVRCQQNAWIHLIATGMVVAAGFFFRLLRSAEFLGDAASPNFHPVVRDAKNVAAAAVLITALASSVIGAVIFWPHVEGLLAP